MQIFQLHAELRGYKPKMWRRFQVAPGTTLEHLGCILMALFHMDGSHPFDFSIPGTRESYVPQSLKDWEGKDASKVKLESLLDAGSKIVFTYDFGDSWEVIIKVEKIIDDPDLGPKALPKVLDGKGYGIIDDCGGVEALMAIAKALKDKDSPVDEELEEWVEEMEDMDMDAFDLKEMNAQARRAPKRFSPFFL